MTNVTETGSPEHAVRGGHLPTDDFGRIGTGVEREIDFRVIQRSTEFRALRRNYRRFVFPVCLIFFAWYMAYVLLAAYAHDFMSYRLVGQINVGLVLGVLQFVSTGLITVLYIRFAGRKLDPAVDAIRAKAEGGDR